MKLTNRAMLPHLVLVATVLTTALGCESAAKYEYDRRWDTNATIKAPEIVRAEMASDAGQKIIALGCLAYLRNWVVVMGTGGGLVLAILSALGIHLTGKQKNELQKIVMNGMANGNGKPGGES